MNDFPLDEFPTWFADMVRQVSERMQTPIVLAANFGLSIVSAILALRVYVSLGGRDVPTNLWTMTLLPAGEGKSPVLKEMARPIYSSEIGKHIVEDISVTGVYRKLNQLRKIFMLSAEGTFFDIFLRDRGQSLTALMKSYDEERISYDRGNNVDFKIDKPSLTIGLAVQNDRFAQYFSERGFQTFLTTGLLDRFLPAVPESSVGRRKFLHHDNYEVFSSAWENYETAMGILRRDYSFVAPNAEDTHSQQDGGANSRFEVRTVGNATADDQGSDSRDVCPAPIYLRVSDDAGDIFSDWKNDRLEPDFNEPCYASIHQWMGKMDGFVLRIAGNLHVMHEIQSEMDGLPHDLEEKFPLDDDAFTISSKRMEGAIRLVEYYRNERLKLTGNIGRSEEIAADKIRNYFRRKNLTTIKRYRLRNALKETDGLKAEDDFQRALTFLEENGEISIDGADITIME